MVLNLVTTNYYYFLLLLLLLLSLELILYLLTLTPDTLQTVVFVLEFY
jgi:hypothetical protein